MTRRRRRCRAQRCGAPPSREAARGRGAARMTSSSTTAAARKRFDQAMSLFDNDQSAAQARFREATEIDPSMADAWLGRIAAGDEALSTLQQLYAYGARLHRETNRLGVRLSASIKAGPY